MDLESATSRPYGGVPAEARREERRERLIEAGTELFGRDGYRTATIESVCRESGLAKRYFYESFGSKEDLLSAVYDHLRVDLRDRVAVGALSGTEGMTAVLGAFDGLLSWVEDNPRGARVHLFEVLGVSPRIDADYRGATQEFAELLVGALVESDTFTAGQSKVLGLTLVGAGLQLAQNWVLNDLEPSRAALVEDARGVLTTLAAAATGG
jgi:AcrR family transcriptional regulator